MKYVIHHKQYYVLTRYHGDTTIFLDVNTYNTCGNYNSVEIKVAWNVPYTPHTLKNKGFQVQCYFVNITMSF